MTFSKRFWIGLLFVGARRSRRLRATRTRPSPPRARSRSAPARTIWLRASRRARRRPAPAPQVRSARRPDPLRSPADIDASRLVAENDRRAGPGSHGRRRRIGRFAEDSRIFRIRRRRAGHLCLSPISRRSASCREERALTHPARRPERTWRSPDAKARLYPDRAPGGDRDHRRADRPAPARGAGGARGRPPRPVHQQPQAARPGAGQLRERQRLLPDGGLRPVSPQPRAPTRR